LGFDEAAKVMVARAGQPLVSICVPTYNGFPYVTSLVDELLRSERADFEIVVSDDCSQDRTWTWIEQRSRSDARLKCYRNERNLGMDGNFAQSVKLAQGKYVWLCGQDDRIFHEGVEALVKCLEADLRVDFVYLNHVKIQEGEPEHLITPVICNDHAYGQGLEEFVYYHDYELPTFLPKFVIRKSLWSLVDIERYAGTSYSQVGVFLEASRDMKWCHLGGNYVVGLTPIDGWQVDPQAYARISMGLYQMLLRAIEKCPWISNDMRVGLCRKYFNRALYSIILFKSLKLNFQPAMVREFLQAARPCPPLYTVLMGINSMPAGFSRVLMKLIELRRSARKRLQ
jgi:glycosyltransferase involved in cell wall biosynthesis